MYQPILPHGGRLVNCLVSEKEQKPLLDHAKGLLKIPLDDRHLSDVEMIAIGALSPLEGFMGGVDYSSVVEKGRLAAGLPWTIPITLAVENTLADKIKLGEETALTDAEGESIAILQVKEKFAWSKEKEASLVYRTIDRSHPGVEMVHQMPEVLLAGPIKALRLPKHTDFLQYRLTPVQTRQIFLERKWRRVVGFQTRNPIHRAHEYIQKCALEVTNGLLLHPLVGKTKGDDVSAEVRMKSYEVMLKHYYPEEKVLLAVMPAAMRYAGPREAIFHAVIRKNYGCTHFIVGRDHAGVKNFYGPFDAHLIFDDYTTEEIGIIPLFFDNTYYCRACGQMASPKTCPHDMGEHVTLSGTKVRELLSSGQAPPIEITRPKVAEVLMEALLTKPVTRSPDASPQ